MIKDYLKEIILQNFGFPPTEQQEELVGKLADFVLLENQDKVFILRGYAGTGKTSIVSALVRTMQQLERECVLIAPTGRAAKVLSLYSNHPAFTIHKRIYRQKSIDQDSIFEMNYNMKANIMFICDEASMISNDYASASAMRVGNPLVQSGLLDDLVHFVYNGKGCSLILLGDTAQLPPVGEGESPALQDGMLSSYGLEVMSYTMTQVVRQAETSGILWNATHLREKIRMEDIFELPKIRFSGFADVRIIPGNELIECLELCYHDDGVDDTIVVTRSNKRAVVYNNGIRAQVLWREEELGSGDQIMVVKNNYYWTEKLMAETVGKPEEKKCPMDFIANGNMAIVRRLRHEREMYGFRFADAELYFPDYDYEMETVVLLDALASEAPALTAEQQNALYERVLEDYEEINVALPGERPLWKRATKKEKLKALKQDPYFNALQIKYAYAITCHKAQGGQWKNVFIDQGYMTEEMLGPDYFRWLYTAITRATGTVYFVNWKEEQVLTSSSDSYRLPVS